MDQQICFTVRGGRAADVREALLDEGGFDPAETAGWTGAQKNEAARLVVVGWARALFLRWRLRREVGTGADIA